MEERYVREVYQKIAPHFSETRKGDKWSYVIEFLDTFTPQSIIADIGCGNGKYIDHRDDIVYIAIDPCKELLDIAKSLYANMCNVQYINGHICDISLKSESVDGFICIAVFHHLDSPEDRYAGLRELVRILKVGGRGMITVWSSQQTEKRMRKWKCIGGNDYLVPWAFRCDHKNPIYYDRYYHVFDKEEILDYISHIENMYVETCVYDHGNWVIIIKRIC